MLTIAKRTLTALTVIGILLVLPASNAYADSEGKCGDHVSNGKELFEEWRDEGVTSQAAEVVKSAGFHAMDGSLKSWMTERVVKAKLAAEVTLVDYGCHPGELFGAGTRTFAKGVSVMIALPLKYAKGEVRFKAHKGYKRTVVWAHSVGKVNCSNPLEGKVRAVIYVKVHKKHKKRKHHKKPQQLQEPPICSGNTTNQNVGTAAQGGNCSINTNTTVCSPVNSPGSVVCSSETPPSKPEPPVVNNLETIQEVEQNEVRVICADVYAPAGDNLTITFNAEYGMFAGKIEYKGTHKVCDTYKAPSETPAGKDTYWVFVQDNTTDLHAESEKKSVSVLKETPF